MPPTQPDPRMVVLAQWLSSIADLEFAVLVGSRAQGAARTKSDWDIALKWRQHADWLALLGTQESLRRGIAEILGTSPEELTSLTFHVPTSPCAPAQQKKGLYSKAKTPWPRRVS